MSSAISRSSAPFDADQRRAVFWIAATFALAGGLLLVNAAFFRFSWIAYLPAPALPLVPLVAWLAWTDRSRDLALFLLCMASMCALATGVQVTPFPPIDDAVRRWDLALGWDVPAVLRWTAQRPWLRGFLDLVYMTTDLQLPLIGFLPWWKGDKARLRALTLALLWAHLAGFLFYYLWPTSGPTAACASPDFPPMQLLTSLKFRLVHEGRPVPSLLGGMIGFPSFHVAWAVLIPWAALGTRWFKPLVVLNALVILSTVLLGWHFLSDVPSGLALGFAAAWAGARAAGLKTAPVLARPRPLTAPASGRTLSA